MGSRVSGVGLASRVRGVGSRVWGLRSTSWNTCFPSRLQLPSPQVTMQDGSATTCDWVTSVPLPMCVMNFHCKKILNPKPFHCRNLRGLEEAHRGLGLLKGSSAGSMIASSIDVERPNINTLTWEFP